MSCLEQQLDSQFNKLEFLSFRVSLIFSVPRALRRLLRCVVGCCDAQAVASHVSGVVVSCNCGVSASCRKIREGSCASEGFGVALQIRDSREGWSSGPDVLSRCILTVNLEEIMLRSPHPRDRYGVRGKQGSDRMYSIFFSAVLVLGVLQFAYITTMSWRPRSDSYTAQPLPERIRESQAAAVRYGSAGSSAPAPEASGRAEDRDAVPRGDAGQQPVVSAATSASSTERIGSSLALPSVSAGASSAATGNQLVDKGAAGGDRGAVGAANTGEDPSGTRGQPGGNSLGSAGGGADASSPHAADGGSAAWGAAAPRAISPAPATEAGAGQDPPRHYTPADLPVVVPRVSLRATPPPPPPSPVLTGHVSSFPPY